MSDKLDARAREVLKQPVIVRINTVTPDGYPHSVPIWFMLDGDDLIVFTERKSAKVKHLLANPHGSLAFGGDPVGSPCYLIEGDFVIEDDPDHAVTSRVTHHYETPERAKELLAAWKNDDEVILRLKPGRVIKIS